MERKVVTFFFYKGLTTEKWLPCESKATFQNSAKYAVSRLDLDKSGDCVYISMCTYIHYTGTCVYQFIYECPAIPDYQLG